VTLVERLRSPVAEECVAAIAELREQKRVGTEELAALADCLGHARKAVQRPAAEAFAVLGERGVAVRDVLVAALASPTPGRRWSAAFALARLHEPPQALLPVLVETLGVDDGDLRWAAATVLVGFQNHGEVIGVLRGLLQAGNAAQRKMALYCLRDLDVRAPDLDEALVRLLDDEDRDVQLAAISSLARLATDRAGAAARLMRALDARDPRLRRAAAAGLGTLGERSESVRAALDRATASPDASLARAAVGALRQLGADRP